MADTERRILRVKVGEQTLNVAVSPLDTLEEVARQVRAAQGWDAQQPMRFISSGQEIFLGDSVSKALGSVLHCIRSEGTAQKYAAAKAGHGHKAGQPGHSPVDWLEVVDPGTVLMWIFGSILALLWLLFVCYAHMFDKTSVVMLCMMTIAFLIPCVLSYIPALRVLQGLGGNIATIPPASPRSEQDLSSNRSASYGSPTATAAGATPWLAYSGTGTYAGTIPPRPAARIRPGMASAQ